MRSNAGNPIVKNGGKLSLWLEIKDNLSNIETTDIAFKTVTLSGTTVTSTLFSVEFEGLVVKNGGETRILKTFVSSTVMTLDSAFTATGTQVLNYVRIGKLYDIINGLSYISAEQSGAGAGYTINPALTQMYLKRNEIGKYYIYMPVPSPFLPFNALYNQTTSLYTGTSINLTVLCYTKGYTTGANNGNSPFILATYTDQDPSAGFSRPITSRYDVQSVQLLRDGGVVNYFGNNGAQSVEQNYGLGLRVNQKWMYISTTLVRWGFGNREITNLGSISENFTNNTKLYFRRSNHISYNFYGLMILKDSIASNTIDYERISANNTYWNLNYS